MERMSQILYSLSLITLMILSSCGTDKSTKANQVITNPLNDVRECALNSEHMPVCGQDINGKLTDYMNATLAECYKASKIFQGHCSCSKNPEKLVCMSTGESLTECNAQDLIKRNSSLRIEKFQACNSGPTL